MNHLQKYELSKSALAGLVSRVRKGVSKMRPGPSPTQRAFQRNQKIHRDNLRPGLLADQKAKAGPKPTVKPKVKVEMPPPVQVANPTSPVGQPIRQ